MAVASSLIINPNNLKIEGWYCQDRFSKQKLILQTQDVREMSDQGLIVNDHEVLAEPGDLIRLKDVLELNFELIGKPVVTISKEHIGKVSDYAADSASLYIQKLYISQSLIKSFTGGGLSIDRTQIVEITNRKIVIQDLLEPVKALPATAPIA